MPSRFPLQGCGDAHARRRGLRCRHDPLATPEAKPVDGRAANSASRAAASGDSEVAGRLHENWA